LAAKSGTVYLVGAGPGDPTLLTLRGTECLRIAEVVVYDSLINPKLLSLAPVGAECVCVGKRHGERSMQQAEINELMIRHARAGRSVARLKGGDPCVFGRTGEEMVALRAANVPFEIVPGVTAGVAAPAYAGIPVTHRDHASAVAFVTGHEDPSKASNQLDWPALASFPGTLVFYMGVRRLPQLADSLMRHGRPADTPAAVIERGTTPNQRTVVGTLSDIARKMHDASMCPPAVIVVGGVAEFATSLRWFEERPLFGQRIVITRPPHQATSAVQRLTALGADVFELPAIRIEPILDRAAVSRAIAEMRRYEWVVFTSANGVEAFRRHVADSGRDARVLGSVRVAVIGDGTANELERQFQVRADLVPATGSSESLVAALVGTGSSGRVLLLRAEQARAALPDGLKAAGMPFDDIAVYRTLASTDWDTTLLSRMEQGEADWIIVTSPRIVQVLAESLPGKARAHIGHAIKVATISPITSAAVRQHGWVVAAEAAETNMSAVADAIALQVLESKKLATQATSRQVS
jgi:uroporphyrinogen III methyltransferase/synthase